MSHIGKTVDVLALLGHIKDERLKLVKAHLVPDLSLMTRVKQTKYTNT